MTGRHSFIAAAALAAALVAMVAPGAAMAGAPISGMVVKGGCNGTCSKGSKANSVIVQLDLGRTESWTYDPAKGALTPGGTAKVDGAPVSGIGVVVKKNPGGGAAMVVPVADDGSMKFPKLDDGSYDVAIRVPNAAFAGRPRNGGERGVELVFTVVKRGDSLVNVVVPTSERARGVRRRRASDRAGDTEDQGRVT